VAGDFNHVVSNRITCDAGESGDVGVFLDGPFTGFDGSDDNKVIRNRFTDCTTDIDDDGSGTLIRPPVPPAKP